MSTDSDSYRPMSPPGVDESIGASELALILRPYRDPRAVAEIDRLPAEVSELREVAQVLRQGFASLALQDAHREAVRVCILDCPECVNAVVTDDRNRACEDYQSWQADVDAAWKVAAS